MFEATNLTSRRKYRLPLARAFMIPITFVLALIAGTLFGGIDIARAQTNDRTVATENPVAGNVPGGSLGVASDADIWRAVRKGLQGNVSIPNKQAGVLIQSEGDNWRAVRNGPITVYGSWVLLGMIGLLALFFAARGRIRIDSGVSGKTIERFNGVERFAHWLTATSFIVMAITGLNMLYGKHVLLPILGPETFTTITQAGKYAHNFISFAFMFGLIIMFVLWIRDNLPSKEDAVWLIKAGGLLSKGVHPPAAKFNAGQKIMFWVVILGGISLSMSGLSLLFPFQIPWFGMMFNITAMQDMQLEQLWHAMVGLIIMTIMIAHIYIGSLGMEGAFAAMGSGQVDENWAREHHSKWVADTKAKQTLSQSGGSESNAQPAE